VFHEPIHGERNLFAIGSAAQKTLKGKNASLAYISGRSFSVYFLFLMLKSRNPLDHK
jgi:hypothetical protein